MGGENNGRGGNPIPAAAEPHGCGGGGGGQRTAKGAQRDTNRGTPPSRRVTFNKKMEQ